jgi:hypothetical protein
MYEYIGLTQNSGLMEHLSERVVSKANENETCNSLGLLPVFAGDPDQLYPDALCGERMTARLVWDDALDWNPTECEQGRTIKIKGFPKDHRVRLFRVEVSSHRTDGVVTNGRAQNATTAAQETCRFRWRIEQLHRESKQLTGLERCQCRSARIQRHHVACVFLVWARLKELARSAGRTVYQLKQDLLDNYLIQQLRKPSLTMWLVQVLFALKTNSSTIV